MEKESLPGNVGGIIKLVGLPSRISQVLMCCGRRADGEMAGSEAGAWGGGGGCRGGLERQWQMWAGVVVGRGMLQPGIGHSLRDGPCCKT